MGLSTKDFFGNSSYWSSCPCQSQTPSIKHTQLNLFFYHFKGLFLFFNFCHLRCSLISSPKSPICLIIVCHYNRQIILPTFSNNYVLSYKLLVKFCLSRPPAFCWYWLSAVVLLTPVILKIIFSCSKNACILFLYTFFRSVPSFSS